MADMIFINNIKAQAIIGIHPEEREHKQPIIVDVELVDMDMQRIAQTDTIEATVDYDVLVQKMLAFIDASQYQLLETLADKTAEFILSEFKPLTRLRLTLRKPQALPQTPDVGVTVERSR